MDPGIDVGTSEVKVVLAVEAQQALGQVHQALTISRPHALWSEQDPQDGWAATVCAPSMLPAARPKALAAVRGLGLSGQMHGATLLDAQDWCRARAMSGTTAAALERSAPRSPQVATRAGADHAGRNGLHSGTANVQIVADTTNHLIVAHEVLNVGHDRTALSSMAKKAQEALGRKRIELIADRGYYKGPEIIDSEKAGVQAMLPKPMTSASSTPSSSRRKS
jgi:hypothetical protein